jgi:hypothetical protein
LKEHASVKIERSEVAASSFSARHQTMGLSARRPVTRTFGVFARKPLLEPYKLFGYFIRPKQDQVSELENRASGKPVKRQIAAETIPLNSFSFKVSSFFHIEDGSTN